MAGGSSPDQGQLSAWPLVVTWIMDINTDTHCCRAMDTDMFLGGSPGQDIIGASGGIKGYSRHVFLTTLEEPSVPHLHCIHPILLLFLSPLLTT